MRSDINSAGSVVTSCDGSPAQVLFDSFASYTEWQNENDLKDF